MQDVLSILCYLEVEKTIQVFSKCRLSSPFRKKNIGRKSARCFFWWTRRDSLFCRKATAVEKTIQVFSKCRLSSPFQKKHRTQKRPIFFWWTRRDSLFCGKATAVEKTIQVFSKRRLSSPFQKKNIGRKSARYFFGGPGGTRTLDLCVANAPLSQLSYEPVFINISQIAQKWKRKMKKILKNRNASL